MDETAVPIGHASAALEIEACQLFGHALRPDGSDQSTTRYWSSVKSGAGSFMRLPGYCQERQ